MAVFTRREVQSSHTTPRDGGVAMEQGTPAELIGSWTLASAYFTMSDNGEVIAHQAEGICTFDKNGRWTVFAMPKDAKAPANEQERAAIYDRLVAFSGRCVFQGNRLEVTPDNIWNPALKGQRFVRFLNLDGDCLTITQPEWEHPFFPGRKTVATILWQRER
jgi:hypothetical protein